MKTNITLFHVSKRAFARAFTCAFAALALAASGVMPAADHIFSTGSSAASLSNVLVAGDTILLSGDERTVALADGRTLSVSDWVETESAFSINGAKNNLTFRPRDAAPGQWAYLGMSGTTFLMVKALAAGTNTLHMDNVILANGLARALRVDSGGDGTTLIIDGNIVFLNNSAATDAGGAMAAGGDVVFTGTTVFQGNKSGYKADDGTWQTTGHAGAYIMSRTGAYTTTFKAPVFFLSNTSSIQAGALFAQTGNSVIFEDTATFRGNASGGRGNGSTYHGGAIYFNVGASGTLLFKGDAVFDSNKSGAAGGALAVNGAGATVEFLRSATFANNSAPSSIGGGLYVASGVPAVYFYGDVTVSGNDAGNHGGGIGAESKVVFSGTQGANGTTVKIENNTAAGGTGRNGGGIYNGGAATGVEFTGKLLDVTRNSTTGQGGGIRSAMRLLVNGDYNFTQNQAAVGGGVYAPSIMLNGSGLFDGNIASQTGGAVHMPASGSMHIQSGAVFSNNAAGTLGGAIYAEASAKMTLTASTAGIRFQDNVAGATITTGTNGRLAASGGTANAIYFAGSGTLDIHAEEGHSVLFHDPITGAETSVITLRKTGAGVLAFDRHTSGVSFNTTIAGGTLQLTDGAVYGKAGSGAFTLDADTHLAGNGTILAKDLTINNGAALTVLDGGKLAIEATGGSVSVGNELRLAGSGTLSVGVAALNALSVGVGVNHANGAVAETLFVTGSLALTADAVLRYDLHKNNSSDHLHAAGVSLLGTGTIDLGLYESGTFALLSWTGAGLAAGDLSNLSLAANGLGLTDRNHAALSIATDGKSLVLSNTTVSLAQDWTGADGNVWQSSPSESANWTDDNATNPENYFRNGDSVTFGPSASGSITVGGAGITASGIGITTSNTLVFRGGAIVTDSTSAGAGSSLSGATGKLVKSGAGTLVFSNTGANNFAGGVDISGGVIAFERAGQLAVAAGKAITFLDTGTLRADANTDAGIGGETGPGQLATGIVIADGVAATIDTQSNKVAFFGNLSLATLATSGTLVKTGAGTLEFAGDNSAYTGDTRINAGSLLLASGAQLGGAVTTGSGAILGGSGTVGGDVRLLPGSTLHAGTISGGGRLDIQGTLTLADSTLVFGFDGTVNDTLNAGSINASGSNIIDVRALITGTYTLGNIAGMLATSGTVVVTIDGNPQVAGTRQRAEVRADAAAPANLLLVYGADKSRRLAWTGAGLNATEWNTSDDNWSGSNDTGKFAAGDTVVFNRPSGGDLSLSILGTARVSDIEVTGPGALTFTDGEIVADATSVQLPGESEITNAGGRLLKSGGGLLVFANAANTFGGGIRLSGGTLAFSRAGQINTTGAAITFDANATLRADGAADMTLANNIVINDGAIATLAAGALTLTLTGSTGGGGTLAKTGDGTLVYSGINALAHAATRVDGGLVRLTNITAAEIPDIRHTFEINGGWLDLSDAPGFDATGTTANQWDQLTLTGDTGRIIGSNDKITLRDAAIGFGIGSETDETRQGLFVVVDAGPGGVATMSGGNFHAGNTRLVSGALRVSDDAQLGLASLNREIIFEGAEGTALEISGAGFSTSRAIELRSDGIVSVLDAGALVTWDGSITGAGAFTKAGDGTLVFRGANNHASGVIVAGGTLVTAISNLQGPVATVANNAALVISQNENAVYSGTIDGGGKVFKSGPGTLALEGRVRAAGFTIDGGAITIAPVSQIVTTSAFTINPAGTLRGTGTVGGASTLFTNKGSIVIGRAAGLPDYGTLSLAGDYTGANGAISLAVAWQDGALVRADKLLVSGSITGKTFVSLAVTATTGMSALAGSVVISAQGGSTDDAFELDRRYVSGLHDLELANDGGNWALVGKEIPPEIPPVIGVDAASVLIGKASVDSFGKHIQAARSTHRPHRFELWMSALYRGDNIAAGNYDGAESRTAGVQAGADWSLTAASGVLTLGLYCDYAGADMTLPHADSSTRTQSKSVAAYAAWHTPAWYIDGLVRAGRESHTVSVFRTPSFDMDGDSLTASIEGGRTFKAGSSWYVEPQAQLAFQTHSIGDGADHFGRRYTIDSAKSLEGRAGVRFWEKYEWKPGLFLVPYGRISGACEFLGRGRVTITDTRTGVCAPFENDLSGFAGVFDAGLSMQLGGRFTASLDATWYPGNKLDGYSINLGLAYGW
jgi:outer membrane autotransporter protein